MTRNACFCSTLLAFAALALLTAPAAAANIPTGKANGTFIAGSGIPGNNFTVATAGSGDSVALKGRQRDTGQALSQSGNIYYVPVWACRAVGPGQRSPQARWHHK